MKFTKPFACIALALSVLSGCSTSTTTQPIKAEPQSKPKAQTINQTPVRLQTIEVLNSTVAKENKGKMTAEQIHQCQSLGGNINKRGKAQFEYCQITFEDAGKMCQDGSECQSRSCITTSRGVMADQPNQTGVCTQSNNGFGCQQTITKGRANQFLCKD